MSERHEWGDWLRAQFDNHPRIRKPADLSKAAGTKDNGRPVIDPSRITQWLRGQRPSYDLTVVTAKTFGASVLEALWAAGYAAESIRSHPMPDGTAVIITDGHRQPEQPVGLGLDDAAADLAPEQIEAIRALIRSMKPGAAGP